MTSVIDYHRLQSCIICYCTDWVVLAIGNQSFQVQLKMLEDTLWGERGLIATGAPLKMTLKDFQARTQIGILNLINVMGSIQAVGVLIQNPTKVSFYFRFLVLLKFNRNKFKYLNTHYSKSQIFVQKFNFDKTPTFSRVFHPNFFLTIFLVKSKLSTDKKSKTAAFSRVFTKNN